MTYQIRGGMLELGLLRLNLCQLADLDHAYPGKPSFDQQKTARKCRAGGRIPSIRAAIGLEQADGDLPAHIR
ncbi:hypothetical protein [Teichococcus vastitatis]|uniref:Uncharacterized protein n=1 Tax=Teichococcus vastitatis TaxID=2307076 RepID=A0ABS9WAJ7_9PROT|nr:hypothetical protein [Pseudoroseomonas vastitatis]MCI0756322.1 hypothetical protein [Pseudoroseomonas vastitatis]